MSERTRRRVATVVLAPIAALVAWGVIRLLDVDLKVSMEDDSVSAIGPAEVAVTALIGALAGWIVALLVERWSEHPRKWWPVIATTTLAISMIGPGSYAVGNSWVGLMALHFVVAIVVIVGFVPTLQVHCERGARAGSARRPSPSQ